MAQGNMTLQDWLDDLCVRFIINLPREDLSSVARICFQIEEAQWFYEDFIRPLDPSLPSMGLRTFSLKMFQHCPLLASFSAESHIRAFEEFIAYKQRVPVRGAIMLNDAMDAVVLVRGYKKGSRWSFPRGKINKDEDDLDCAVREVYEETGYDLREAGLIDRNEPLAPLQVTMRDQHIQLFVFRGIPEDTVFKTRTRKEIGDIKWYGVSELPAYRKKGAGKNNGADGLSNDKFHLVAPFMVQLRQWVLKQRRLDSQKANESSSHHRPQALYEDTLTDDNAFHEPAQTSPARESNSDFIDSATKELQRLLKVRPPTQGLQIPSATTNLHAGQALLSLLQPRVAGDEQAPSQSRGVPRAPSEHTFAEASQPPPSHHQHTPQRVSVSGYGLTPSSSLGANPGVGYQQPRARPHVDIPTEVPHPSMYSEQTHQFRSQPPVQLVHPQPLPPQVQKAMLLHGMASTPQAAEPTTNRPWPTGLPQGNPHINQGTQFLHGTQNPPSEKKPSSLLSEHSASLLNALKSSAIQSNSGQQPKPISSQQGAYIPVDHQSHPQPIPPPKNGYTGQYSHSSTLASSFNSMTTNHAQPGSTSSDLRPLHPTDKHRAGLLDMFKTTDSSQSALDEDGAARRSSQPDEAERKRQWADQSPSAANTLRSAAYENGRLVQMNPETNLPFRALGILSRPRGNQSPGDVGQQLPDASRYSAVGSQGSRKSSFTKASPRPHQHSQPKPQPQPMAPTSRSDYQSSTQSYPYGPPQGAGPNSLGMYSNPPPTSALPVPSGVQFQKDSTAEQKNTLLSLFGKPRPGPEQDKGKEPATSDQFGPGGVPRSRLGSVTSSEGKSALRGGGSRRESQTALSSADRNFLLNFLENASGNARR
ncbi:hypothetical protein GGS23DRAFT_568515 [Durotheca rogersii]|uniref:uncharacterized protein n=1 Tax=Durotheca rogersii TaxID=419775 RepID=UPI00221F0CC2|nr:uncharacterized protein GGS23DRAFT_568515 [Durotheca rogersii]KAI5863157.1 hypothetical protein GGS23DRAFT_568515 [Durotheca rogersii]